MAPYNKNMPDYITLTSYTPSADERGDAMAHFTNLNSFNDPNVVGKRFRVYSAKDFKAIERSYQLVCRRAWDSPARLLLEDLIASACCLSFLHDRLYVECWTRVSHNGDAEYNDCHCSEERCGCPCYSGCRNGDTCIYGADDDDDRKYDDYKTVSKACGHQHYRTWETFYADLAQFQELQDEADKQRLEDEAEQAEVEEWRRQLDDHWRSRAATQLASKNLKDEVASKEAGQQEQWRPKSVPDEIHYYDRRSDQWFKMRAVETQYDDDDDDVNYALSQRCRKEATIGSVTDDIKTTSQESVVVVAASGVSSKRAKRKHGNTNNKKQRDKCRKRRNRH